MMDTIIIKSEPKQTKALKEILKAFNVSFTITKQEDKPYDPEFVKMVLKRSASAKKGNVTPIDPNDLWGSLGLK